MPRVISVQAACGVQTSGEALYTSDIGLGSGELHAAPVLSTQALATLEHVDASRALKVCPSLLPVHLRYLRQYYLISIATEKKSLPFLPCFDAY